MAFANATGMILGILIRAACRWFDIPVPRPPKLIGALLGLAMTVGYLATDKLIATKFAARGPATTEDLCGGPTVRPLGRRIALHNSDKTRLPTLS